MAAATVSVHADEAEFAINTPHVGVMYVSGLNMQQLCNYELAGIIAAEVEYRLKSSWGVGFARQARCPAVSIADPS